MSTQKRTSLSAAQKRELCEAKVNNPSLSNVELSRQYSIGKTTVTDILKEKERWLSITSEQDDLKKFRGPKWPQLERALSLWVDNALNAQQDITGNILKEKANHFAAQFSINDFHSSDGWLTGFKNRHGLRQFRKQGEAASAPSVEQLENERISLQTLLSVYSPEDIWNGDETGLFWKMEPSRVLARTKLSGHKKDKSRITIFCAANSLGTEKMRLSFIHRYRRPRAMQNLNYNNLPVYYYWNKTAWMQVSIFNEILLTLNKNMKEQNRNILLLIDNAPVHIVLEETVEKLDSVKVEFLPPNTTTFLQPCDAGIIHSFKCKYRTLFVRDRIKAYDDLQNGTTKELADYTIYNALINAADAWSNVSSQTIHNCWLKTGILLERTIVEPSSINDKEEEKDLETLLEKLPYGNNLSANEYIHIEDENAWISLTDKDIIEMVNQEEEESNEEEIGSSKEIEIISNTIARESVDTILKYLFQQEPEFGEVDEEVKVLRRLNRRIGLAIQKNLKQPDLHHYFEDKMIE
jgi:hypothetical protein